jgi:signal peptidase I
LNPRLVLRFLRDLVVVLAVTFVLISLTVRFVAAPWVIDGASMEPTLQHGDRVLIDLWTYGRRAPVRGEVVVVEGPDQRPLVKRVALGPLPRKEAPFLSPFRATEGTEDWFEVLGDNPAQSTDSRAFGPVPRHRFRGRVPLRYWPLGRAGPIE